jgi:hypothetical protein
MPRLTDEQITKISSKNTFMFKEFAQAQYDQDMKEVEQAKAEIDNLFDKIEDLNIKLLGCITPHEAKEAVEQAKQDTAREIFDWLDSHIDHEYSNLTERVYCITYEDSQALKSQFIKEK